MKHLISIAAVAVLAGCASLVPSEKQRSESVRSTEAISASHDLTVRRALEVLPEYGLIVPSNGVVTARNLPPMRENLEITSRDSQNAGSHDAAKGSSEVTIPLGVKLGLLGAGICLIVGAFLVAWHYLKTTGIGQGLILADDILSRSIQRLRDKAMHATDPGLKAHYLSEIAAQEAERGKAAAAK